MAQMGRPRTFDRDEALEQALHLFWEQGYEATSLNQLKTKIGGGITAPSFYAAFSSKEALFREIVELYLNSYAHVTDSLRNDTLPPREAIAQALYSSAKMQCDIHHPKGCMVTLGIMSAPTPENMHITQALTESRNLTQLGFIHCVQRAIDQGELIQQTNAEALGTIFSSFLSGVTVLVRDGVELTTINQSIYEILKIWDNFKKN